MSAPATAGMRRPLLTRTRPELTAVLDPVRAAGGRVALVPTMGALHDGHASLVREARRAAAPGDAVVVSIFVNPLQFGPSEDLARYPRSLQTDLEVCAGEGVDVVFAPEATEMYPNGEPQVVVDPGSLGHFLEGRVRPTHFRGVLTVVAKLFGLVRPQLAVFGEKDYQQLVLVRQMTTDLAMPVAVVGSATVRDGAGLALSSRNRYFDAGQREVALTLSRALFAAVDAAERGGDGALGAACAVLDQAAGLEVDYLELTSESLTAPPDQGPARLLVAARVGPVRLIDNVALVLGPRAPTTA